LSQREVKSLQKRRFPYGVISNDQIYEGEIIDLQSLKAAKVNNLDRLNHAEPRQAGSAHSATPPEA
jgi:hypothetical protein